MTGYSTIMRKLFTLIIVLLFSMFAIESYCQSLGNQDKLTESMDSLSKVFGDLYGAGMGQQLREMDPSTNMEMALKGIEYIANADTCNDFVMGLQMGMQIAQLYKGVEQQCGIPLNKGLFMKHMRDAFLSDITLSQDEMYELQNKIEPMLYKVVEQSPRAIANKKAGEEYMAGLKNDKNYTFTQSGIAFKVIKEGTGDYFNEDDIVIVRYEGRHLNGEVFEASDEEPDTLDLTSTIAGFAVVVQLMKPGGKVTAVIPPEQAYGAMGTNYIEPNETLIFDIEAIGVQE